MTFIAALVTRKALFEIGVQYPIPFLLRHLNKQIVACYTGIINQYIDTSEGLYGFIDKRLSILGPDKVAHMACRLVPCLFKGLNSFVNPLCSAAKHHIGTKGCEFSGDLKPDTPGRTRYNHVFICKIHVPNYPFKASRV
jgi:hypothetical protein